MTTSSTGKPDPAAGPDPRPVEPVDGPLDVTVRVPGSKSLTNRALVCAALAGGTSWLTGALLADDTEAMMSCLRRLGADVDVDVVGEDNTIEVVGVGGNLPEGPLDLDVRLSGTTARFLLPVLGIGPGPYRLDGASPLRARPMEHGLAALQALGVEIDHRGSPGHLPVVVHGYVTGAEVEVAGSLSSQFVSGLMLAAPCYHDGLSIRVTGDLVSAPYVELTAQVMRIFGAAPTEIANGRLAVAGEGYRPVTPFAIEPDASSASYFFAAAAIVGGRVRVDGLGSASGQGDLGFVDVLGQMGAEVERGADFTEVRGNGELRGIDVDLAELPDMAQTLAAVAVFADGPTTVRGVGFIRHHETDRIAAVVAELRRCGIRAEETEDGFVVQPGAPAPATIETYDDHRMAMSFALLGLRTPGIRIADPGCVAKTFPGYWDALDQLRSDAVPPTD
jgi:3-phosphoshikimate 1-carboxyvinyltransferase